MVMLVGLGFGAGPWFALNEMLQFTADASHEPRTPEALIASRRLHAFRVRPAHCEYLPAGYHATGSDRPLFLSRGSPCRRIAALVRYCVSLPRLLRRGLVPRPPPTPFPARRVRRPRRSTRHRRPIASCCA